MFRYIMTLLLLTCSTAILCAQDHSKETSHKWKEMKQVNPNLKETNTIRIFDDQKNVYQLELKDGRPFNGYEISDEQLLGELNYVNYYQNGLLVAKYAIDYLNMDTQTAPLNYTLKTTYHNGKALDGPVYHELPHGVVRIDQYQNGQLIGFMIDLFAMHYFNRLEFQLKDNKVMIHDMQSNNELHIYKKDGFLQADFYKGKKRVATSQKSVQQIDQIAPHATTAYYLDEDGILREFHFIKTTFPDMDDIENDFLSPLFSQFSFEFDGDLNLFFDQLHNKLGDLGNMDKRNFATIFHSYSFPYDEKNYLGAVSYNAKSKPDYGITIQRLDSGTYQVQRYVDGKVTSTKTTDDLHQWKEVD